MSVNDLEACASEPIHVPGAIQPHGALLTLSRMDLGLVRQSMNLQDYLPGGLSPERHAMLLAEIGAWAAGENATLQTELPAEQLSVVAHRSGDEIVVELEQLQPEATGRLLTRLSAFAPRLATQKTIDEAMAVAAEFMAELTGFDRVLVYKFDEDWNGQVVAEHGNGELPSYMDLRFPSSDIPAQARRLYAENRVRMIPDAHYAPVPIVPVPDSATRGPLDLSQSQLRSVSPVHLEYMRNMGTAASMSVSIMVDGRLWGLVSCHSLKPHGVPSAIRDACDFIVQSLAMRISSQAAADEARQRVALNAVHARLLTAMTAMPAGLEGLFQAPEDLLALTNAAGVALVVEDRSRLHGACPDEGAIGAIADWLNRQEIADTFVTDNLAQESPELEALAALASGILAIRISELRGSWLIWFRPEVVRTVTWGGDPHKAVHESGRIHPRKSFESWKELLRSRSTPWQPAEIAAARDLRNSIIGIVLRRAEELASLTEELQRSNKELEAFSYSVSHDLRAPFRHIVGFSQLLQERNAGLDDKSKHYLRMISDSALAAGKLVDDLLNFSHLGRTAITVKRVDMNKLVAEVKQSLQPAIEGRSVEWRIEPLPVGWGDATLIRQVWYNLLDNALKYSRPRDTAVITISGECTDSQCSYSVADNGVGFDMAYHAKLFGVFQRLQRVEDFEGTGIGLALVRRIIERHAGHISAVGQVDHGATFTFTLPIPN